MAYYVKIIKNTTANPIELFDVGVTVPAMSNFTIDNSEWELWGLAIQESPDSELVTYIKSGSLVVNSGTSDLSVQVGILHLKIGIKVGQVAVEDETPDFHENKILPGTGIIIEKKGTEEYRYLEISSDNSSIISNALTHTRNSSGTILKTYERCSGSHIDMGPLIVVDNNGNIVIKE